MNNGLLPGLVAPITNSGPIHIGPTGTATTVENVLSLTDDHNDYYGIFVQNLNLGTTASTDIVMANKTVDTDAISYFDIGVNGINNANPFNTLFAAKDAYIFTGGGAGVGAINIASGSTSPVKIGVGGLLTANEVARFTTAGMNIGLAGTLTGAIAFQGSTSGATTLKSANAASGTLSMPAVTDTLAVLGTAQSFTAAQTFTASIEANNAVTASANAATVPVTSSVTTVTNNSAATLTITITTTNAVNRQKLTVCILDSSAAAQTITWVNTENSIIAAPVTSNGSTTLPLTVAFMYNNATSKWRCVGVA